MTKFLFVYYGGKMEADPKAAAKSMEVWNKWFSSLGKAVVDQGAPTMPGKSITSAGVKAGVPGDPVTGYTIVQADSLDAAVALTKKSPGAVGDGKIAVYQLMQM